MYVSQEKKAFVKPK